MCNSPGCSNSDGLGSVSLGETQPRHEGQGTGALSSLRAYLAAPMAPNQGTLAHAVLLRAGVGRGTKQAGRAQCVPIRPSFFQVPKALSLIPPQPPSPNPTSDRGPLTAAEGPQWEKRVLGFCESWETMDRAKLLGPAKALVSFKLIQLAHQTLIEKSQQTPRICWGWGAVKVKLVSNQFRVLV